MKKNKINSSFVGSEGANARVYETVTDFYLIISGKNDTIHDFSVWLGTCSNKAEIKRFQSHTGKYL